MPSSIRESGFADLAPIAELSAFARRRPLWRGAASRGVAGKFGLACVVLTLGAALFGPLLAPHDPFAITGGSLVPPSAGHWMGTDALGRDVLSGVLYGARTSLVIASAVSTIALLVGTVIGMLAGYHAGWIDNVLTRVTELFQVMPRFFFVIIAVALFGPGLDRLILTLGLTSWPILARVARGEVIAMRDLDFVRASEAIGATPSHVVWHQLLPNVMPSIVVALGLLFGQVLLLEATLGFLGLGDPSAVSWGMMAAQAQGFLREAWWLALFPGLAISVAVLGANLVADAFSSGG